MGLGLFALAFVGSAVGLWLVSHITEAMRPVPQTPEPRAGRRVNAHRHRPSLSDRREPPT